MKDNTDTPQATDRNIQLSNQASSAQSGNNWQQLKSEGGSRLQRIARIFQAAFSKTKTELQSGAKTMRPLAQELSTTVAENLKENSKTTATQINETWKDSPDKATALRSLLLSFAQAAKAKLLPWYKVEAKTIDTALTKSYGDRYGSAKRKFKGAKARYVQATAPLEVSVEEKAVTADADQTESITPHKPSGDGSL
ncbi:MAG: hypothetical protein WA902_02330 [Thermosynechococcaceae cyanobacterium]